MKTKRVIGLLMSLILLVSAFGPNTVCAESDSNMEETLYSDDFSGDALTDIWSKSSTNAQIENGVLISKDNKTFWAYLSGLDGASEWADYSVRAEVTIKAANSGQAVAGVALRSSENSWYGGYIMKLSYQNQKVYLYSKLSNDEKLSDSLASASFSIELNETYQLKLTAKGDELTGYIDGEKVLEYTASAENLDGKNANKYDQGYPGVMVNSGTVEIDNFMVTKTRILFCDDFSEPASSSDWEISGNGQMSDGTLNGKNKNTFYAYLSKLDKASEWMDYSVEADFSIVEADSRGMAVAGIALQSSESSWYGGYMLKISYHDKKVYLYSRKADGSNGLISLADTTLETVEIGETYHLKLTVAGERLIGYIDGVIVLDYIASAENLAEKSAKKNDKGYPGVLVNNGVITVDNFVATSIPDNSIVIGKTDENETVYIDGKPSVEAKESGIVTVKHGQSVQIIAINPDDGNKVLSNKIYLVRADGKVIQPECLQDAISYEGTAIRTTGNKGIRFKSSITTAAKESNEELTLKEYGTVVTKKAFLGGDDLYLDASYKTVKGVAYEKEGIDYVFDEAENAIRFTGVLVNITESNYGTVYAARPYAIYEDAEGTQYKIYGNTVCRSLSEIAQLALEDKEYGYTEEEQAYFQSIVDGVRGN